MIKALLTIDDVSSKNTPKITDYLKEKGITAIMFGVGKNIERYPDEAIYALKNGMIIGNHSYSHPHFSEISPEDGINEIEKNEALLEDLYRSAGVSRVFRPFRFPYGDKGGKHKAVLQKYLADNGFDKVRDTDIPYAWWKENGLDRDIDTLWTFDFGEYNIRPGSGFTADDVLKRIYDPDPVSGAAMLADGGRHIILIHAHDETEEMVPDYFRKFIGLLPENGVMFDQPAFLAGHNPALQ